MLCQITQKFDEVMAVASSPRPTENRKLYFESDEIKSSEARYRFDSSPVIFTFEDRDPYSSKIMSDLSLTFTDALQIIVAVFQSQPLSLKYLAMKKVLELNLDVKDLPQTLQVKAEKVR